MTDLQLGLVSVLTDLLGPVAAREQHREHGDEPVDDEHPERRLGQLCQRVLLIWPLLVGILLPLRHWL